MKLDSAPERPRGACVRIEVPEEEASLNCGHLSRRGLLLIMNRPPDVKMRKWSALALRYDAGAAGGKRVISRRTARGKKSTTGGFAIDRDAISGAAV